MAQAIDNRWRGVCHHCGADVLPRRGKVSRIGKGRASRCVVWCWPCWSAAETASRPQGRSEDWAEDGEVVPVAFEKAIRDEAVGLMLRRA